MASKPAAVSPLAHVTDAELDARIAALPDETVFGLMAAYRRLAARIRAKQEAAKQTQNDERNAA